MASKEVRQRIAYLYRDALNGSGMWIRIAFKGYLAMSDKLVLNIPFLYYILGKGTEPYKMDKESVNYGLSSVKGELCGGCVYAYRNIVDNKNICSQVKGDIDLVEWCRLWEGKNQESKFN